jgi:competence protein ComEC
VDLLIAPHHGSQSSSGPAFLNALAPAIVIVSAGHKNRFGHPHRTVVDRYERRGAMVITTAEGGAMSWAAGSAKVEAMRRVRRPWHFP